MKKISKHPFPSEHQMFESQEELDNNVDFVVCGVNMDLLGDVLRIMKEKDMGSLSGMGVSKATVRRVMQEGNQNISIKEWLQVCKAIGAQFVPPRIQKGGATLAATRPKPSW